MIPQIALVGDFNPEVTAHRAINEGFSLANRDHRSLHHQWIGTDTIVPGDQTAFAAFHGIWCTPASPYRNTDSALWAIQYARSHSVPFLGTCGGYQHALLEFARNVLHLKNADHAETNPAASLPLVYRMQCSLIEQSQPVIVTDENFRRLYGTDKGLEGYHCSYSLNPEYERLFESTPLKIVARSEDGHARAFQLKNHPFFIGTQFQPERRALNGSLHPLVQSFFSAVEERIQTGR